MKKVCSGYGKAAGWVVAGVIFAFIVANFINAKKLPCVTDNFVRYMRVGTGSLFAAATLGRCGWSIQTWSGDTQPERWNRRIFLCLYIAGFALLLLSFLIKPTIGMG